MTETTEQRPSLPQVMPAGGQVVAVVPQSVEEIFRVAKGVVQSGLAPYALTGKTDTPEAISKATSAVAIVIMAGAELGLPPMVALRSFTAINGRPALYGDGLINVVRRSGKASKIDVGFVPGGTTEADYYGPNAKGYCEAVRGDTGETKRVEFSVRQAMRAGLWQTDEMVWKDVWSGPQGNRTKKREQVPNDSPWFRYPERMLGWRAAGFCLRELFGDVLGGITDDWEAREISGMIEINPQPPTNQPPSSPSPPPAPPPTDVKKSDHLEGGENEANAEDFNRDDSGTTTSGSSTEVAKDVVFKTVDEVGTKEARLNDDDSGMITHPVTESAKRMDAYFTRLDEEMSGYETDIDFLNAWEDAKVEEQLAGNPEALERAAKLKAKHLDRIDAANRAIAEDEQGQGRLVP